jgi:hypothetical protein
LAGDPDRVPFDQSFKETSAALKQKGLQAGEKAARRKAGYEQKVEAQLKEWGAKIDVLKSRADASREEVRTKYLAQVEELWRKQETAKERLQDLRQSGSQAWGDLKTGLDQVLQEMKKSMIQALSRFKEK